MENREEKIFIVFRVGVGRKQEETISPVEIDTV